jgi:hypothetical protein
MIYQGINNWFNMISIEAAANQKDRKTTICKISFVDIILILLGTICSIKLLKLMFWCFIRYF